MMVIIFLEMEQSGRQRLGACVILFGFYQKSDGCVFVAPPREGSNEERGEGIAGNRARSGR